MHTRCTSNSIATLPRSIQRFAFTQNEKGEVDLTTDREYEVFGLRSNSSGKFYLVLTDSIHDKLPWWMPAQFFGPLIGDQSEEWESRSWGKLRKDTILAHPAYFEAIDDIEDGTQKGYEAFHIMRDAK